MNKKQMMIQMLSLIKNKQELIDLITEAEFKVIGGIERRSKFIYITGIKM